ncbi:hypothetical protein CspeluHIS016_0304950 [Cutaneotrichosporon spelunceum]|uniref:Uncharacterized protein n=1 Tax=Cutaneotrichosporon spelunceum TaxID=1672016 RepID=A0AAD3TTL6_9TREE|nr:hypothetical protein CspeluHIS016_0304950 [Cutaneotrichosporon spelunceum]
MAPLSSYNQSTSFANQVDFTSPDYWRPNSTQRVTLIVSACYVVVIGICWHVPYLCEIIYPFKLLVLTCAKIESIQLDPNEGGCTRMRGGVHFITLPAGYLGSSAIGAALIACGFDINASKVACLVLSGLLLLTLYWARKSWIAYATFLFTAILIVVTWLVYYSIPLRFLVLFIGVMSCLYCIWDIIDDTLARKVATSDASEFAKLIGCGNSYTWGAFWLIIAVIFFGAGLLIGLLVFKATWDEQKAAAEHFLGGTPWP